MGAEHRNAERKQLKRFLTVLDGSNGKVLGRMVDVSSTGMMLICDEPLQTHQQLLVDIQVPRASKPISLKLRATTMWSRTGTTNQRHHGCGLRFDDMSTEQQRLLDRLILSDSSL